MKMNIESICDVGYDDFFESVRVKLGFENLPVARVVAEHKGLYRVMNEHGEYEARVTGKRMFDATGRADFPAVGDFVVLDKVEDDKAVILEMLPRKTLLERRQGSSEKQIIASNVDVAFIVGSVDRDYSVNRFERYCALARDGGIVPVAILNKIDLISKEERNEKERKLKERLGDGVSVFCTSTESSEGLDALKASVKSGETYCFLGSSGTGKSSLINSLLGNDKLSVSAVGERTGRGRHTTVAREMFFLENGAIVIDNPGVREVGLTDMQKGVSEQFAAFEDIANQCKFADCTHTHEPGCKLLNEVHAGTIDKDEYQNYLNMERETEHYSMTEYEMRKKDKKFGKFLKRTKKDLKRLHHKDYDM